MNREKKQYQNREQLKGSVSVPRSGKSDNWIFFTAVLVSILFWILIKLSDTYTVPYAFHVNYTNIPKEKRLTSITDSTVNVNVTARGFEIIKLNLFENMDILEINLDNFSLMKKEGLEYYVYTGELTEKLADIIGVPKKNVHFSKNTLSFTLTELSEKELPVVNLVHFEFSEQYDLYEQPILSPERISVYGPAEVLDTLKQVFTDKKSIANINSDRKVRVRLNNPLPDLLKFEPEEVSFQLRVEKFTASIIKIPISISGIRPTIKLFPKTVQVHFKVAQKDYNNVRTNQFEVIPDIQNIDIYTVDRLHLKLIKYPDFIRNLTLDPTDVEFLIIK
jgi:YbbR domain-containing protein